MLKINILFSWFWLLFVAIFIPINLPAGGIFLKKSTFESNQILLAGDTCKLRPSPSFEDLTLNNLPIGTPLSLIRTWEDPDQQLWLQVKISRLELIEVSNKLKRGWINVS